MGTLINDRFSFFFCYLVSVLLTWHLSVQIEQHKKIPNCCSRVNFCFIELRADFWSWTSSVIGLRWRSFDFKSQVILLIFDLLWELEIFEKTIDYRWYLLLLGIAGNTLDFRSWFLIANLQWDKIVNHSKIMSNVLIHLIDPEEYFVDDTYCIFPL